MYDKADLAYGQCDICGYRRGKHMEGCLDGEPEPLDLGLRVSVGVAIVAGVCVWSEEILIFLIMF